VEAGVAINLSTGYVSLYAHAGPSVGVGASASGEAALTFNQSLEDVVGHTGSPAGNALETEIGGGVSGNIVSQSLANPTKVVGGGVSAGPGGGVLHNTTVVSASTPAIHIKDLLKSAILPAACRALGTSC